jgi:hypothetical protein
VAATTVELEHKQGFRGQFSRPEKPDDMAGNMLKQREMKMRGMGNEIEM